MVSTITAFAEPRFYQKLIGTANTDTQIAIVPWPAPAYAKAIVRQVEITNHAATLTLVKIRDEHIGNATPTARGTNALPLLSYKVAANETKTFYPGPEFWQAGWAAQADQNNVHVMLWVEVQLG